MLSEASPTHIRYTGMASSRELAGAIAEGTLPFIAVALQSSVGSWWPVACYAMALGVIVALGSLLLNSSEEVLEPVKRGARQH